MDVVVFGSINMDLVTRVSRLPATGETIIGQAFDTLPGGKGANQAVAIARLGTSVEMVGCVGDDVFGPQLVQNLQAAGVTCDRISTAHSTSSGIATIDVDANGQNRIIVVPGANHAIGDNDLANLRASLSDARILMLQFEIPMAKVKAAAQLAADLGVKVILDPAPAPPTIPGNLLRNVTILTPNQLEAAQWVGFPVHTLDDAERAACVLRDQGADTVIVTMGDQGSLCVSASGEVIHTPCFDTRVIDTVAAGDAFNGGLAAALANGQSLRDSLRWATATAAVAVSRKGAQSAMPTRAELHALFTL
jgi:ribokinase